MMTRTFSMLKNRLRHASDVRQNVSLRFIRMSFIFYVAWRVGLQLLSFCFVLNVVYNFMGMKVSDDYVPTGR